MSDSETLSDLGQAAVWYCENGFAIIPIEPKGKRPYAPLTPHGLNDWFDDPEDARKLWSMYPDLNVAIVCGTPSHGTITIDADEDDEEGTHGLDTLSDWEDVHGELPATATAITGRGGLHYLYRTGRTNIRPSVNHELGVDIRSDGSYIVAPPSVHPNGNCYRWMDGCAPWEREVVTADENVYDLIDHVQRNGGTDDGQRQQPEKFQLPERIKKGERDNTLYRYGCSLRGQGYRDDVILAMLEKANRDRCTMPMEQWEVLRIANSVCKKGPGHDGEGSYRDEGPSVGAPGGGRQKDDASGGVPFRNSKGKIVHNLLADHIVDVNLARRIDGAPAVWNGHRWEFGKAAISRVAISHAKDVTMATRNEVFSYLMAIAEDHSSDTDFDGGYYVQFANCTYDVLNQQKVEPRPEMLITATLPIALDTEAPPGDADRFIESISAGDEPTALVMQEIIGACMCNRRILSQSPMLIGRAHGTSSTASNGKSTYINVIRNVLGSENVSSLDIATLGQRFQAGRIVGKLANLGDDIPDGFLRGEELSTFKKLVTGDQIYTDVKNGDGFEFRPSATMVFSMNAMPRLADTTDGVFRRLSFVPFRRRFSPSDEDFDPNIIERLTTPETLRRFAVLGLFALPGLIRRGTLSAIPDMDAEIETVRIDNSIVRRWLFDENLTRDELVGRTTQEVFEQFKSWCEASGERYILNKTSFSKELLATVGNMKSAVLLSERYGRKMRTYVSC